jgi:triacylglycerol lipase
MTSAPTLLLIAAAVLACWILAVWASGVFYIVVSYIAGRRHVPPRPLVSTLVWALREMWYVAWTQPMLIWFQFFSARMGSGGGTVPIVLVHGYFQNRVDFLYLAQWLRKRGSGPIYACNFFWPQSLERSSKDVRAFISRVLAETGAEKVDVLTHSSGGLFALDIIGDSPTPVRRAVLIALPGRGVPWRGPVLGTSGSQLRRTSKYLAARTTDTGDTPALSIYSAHDNVVHPALTSVITGSAAVNCEIAGPGHLAVLFDRRAAEEACRFLLADGDSGESSSVAE